MSLWVKICGLTTSEAVEAAVDANADAIGFVFAPSKRQVTPECASELARSAPDHIARVAVMLHPTQAEFDAVWSGFRPDVLQIDEEDLSQLVIPEGLQVTPVLRTLRSEALLAKRILFEGAVSGTGTVADWDAAAALAKSTQLILAGGLHTGNVAEALRAVAPFGVDVSSGVERAPGVKDRGKIHEFVHVARAAWTGADR
jgi:phosphoribosylanthranilate isomerase